MCVSAWIALCRSGVVREMTGYFRALNVVMYLVVYSEADQLPRDSGCLRSCNASTQVVGSNFARGMDITLDFVYVVVACVG